MKQRVQQIIDTVGGRLTGFPDIEAVTVHVGAEDVYDPAFSVMFDVYYHGTLPGPEQREERFPDAYAFEASRSNRDRFLFEDLPVRVEYRNVHRFESVLTVADNSGRAVRETGTYSLYRLEHGEIIYSSGRGGFGPGKREDWITDVRSRIGNLPDGFWQALVVISRSRMEHALADLFAAVSTREDLFCLLSVGEFVRALCSVLFAVNRRFEPSGRELQAATLSLRVLPESFRGRFDTIVRQDPDVDLERKREIAELMARSVIAISEAPPSGGYSTD